MDEKSMKSCVRVLRVEAGIRYYFCKVLERIFDVIESCVSFVNWCIVRSILRWVGFPIAVVTGYCAMAYPSASIIDGFTMIFLSISTAIIIATIISWSEISNDEKRVFYEYEKEKEKKI